PPFGAGLAVGIVAGDFAFRRRGSRYLSLAIGVVAAIALAALWHGPAGAADRFTDEVERGIRQTIVYWEIPQVNGHLHHGPLTRRAILSGPADDFQRSQLAQYISQVPGVSSASWSATAAGIPLIVEGAGVALLGFLFGLFGAYLRDIRRRYNAQWNW
ncbi:MAG: hypothetical protein HOP95_05165, partial [Sphingomonas sp.]|nr:hypothetical protein [Sphingomonas sp.]